MPCDPFMSIFGCNFHPIHSITPLYFVHAYLFHLRPAVSFTLFLRYAPLFSFRTVPEQFKGMFWDYPRPFWKIVGESIVMRCILLGIFAKKIKLLFANGIYGGYTDITIGEKMRYKPRCKPRCKPYRQAEVIIGYCHVRFVMGNGHVISMTLNDRARSVM